MNEEYPPLSFPEPEIRNRRTEAPKLPPSTAQAIASRVAKATQLQRQLRPISRRVHRLTEQQRRAFFVKLRHAAPISLTGTGLKQISTPAPNVTLAVPKSDDLNALAQKITAYGHNAIRNNHIPNEILVGRLESIEEGGPLDRLSDDLKEAYNEYVNADWVLVEIEVTARSSGRKQRHQEVHQALADLSNFLGPGVLGQIYEQEYSDTEGMLRAVVGCSGEAFRQIVESPQWQTSITLIDARPTFQTFYTTLRDFNLEHLEPIQPPPRNAPTVCIIDSGLSNGNPFLREATRDELLFSFLRDRPNDVHDENGHGSGVASLASYYLLNIANGAVNASSVWVASARILDEHNDCPDRLLSSVIREAVIRLKPLGVKIFNLSVNVFGRAWNAANRRIYPKRSWVARVIDELARQEDVVFVISAGNLESATVASLNNAAPYPRYLLEDQCCILDPAQSALALTVGSLAATTQIVGAGIGDLRALAQRNQPSPFTRRGPGIRGEIKPELVEYGGNLVQDEHGAVRTNAGCSVMMASRTLNPPVAHDVGTSVAAPKVTNQLAGVMRDISPIIDVPPSAALLKALLVNSARHSQDDREIQRFIEELGVTNVDWQHILGYGVASADRATYCDDYQVLLFYQGTLAHNKVAFFDIPVPLALVGTPRQRKMLTVTVVYHPDVHLRKVNDYLGTALRWRVFRGDTAKEDVMTIMCSDNEVEDARELRGANGIQRRSRGCVQHDVFEWSDHYPAFSANNYTLAVTSFERWNRTNPLPISYSVVVRLEETSRTVPIYNLVYIANEVQVEARVRA